MKKLITIFGAFLISAFASGQELSKVPGVFFSGSPSYISEFASAFRDNGGPLSPYGSHIGLKAEVESKEFAGVRHYACATGKNVLDYSRTGLFALSSVKFLKGGEEIKEAKTRKVRFEYYGWQELTEFDDFSALAYVHFLGLDQYVISIKLENKAGHPLELTAELNLIKRGKQLSLLKTAPPDYALYQFSVQPTITPGKNYLAIYLPKRDLTIMPGEAKWISYIFGYHPDQAEQALALAKEAREKFESPEKAWQRMLSERDQFFSSLPKPHLKPGQRDYLDLYLMSATALDNALYAPRGNMNHWACVPTKVHYNWFWLWDSGFQALGYSEFKPLMARDVILSVFQTQKPDGFIAHMADEQMKPITPHSQPPVFGYTASQIIERYPELPEISAFRKELYEKSKLFLDWWKRARDENHNGLFEYISQDEGGWDNSSRAEYVFKGPFINYYGYLGELWGSKFKPLDNVDLNAWIYFYYLALADWAEELGKREEAKQWREEAKVLAEKIDELMWDEECNCWLDTYGRKGNYKHFYTLTPAIWFPAFAGATRDEQKARAVIEKHLLNPQEFFGKYPIPVVAYNDQYFDPDIPGWRGRIWLFSAYSALETLFKFGYEKEAEELRDRLLAMMADQGGRKGIYETYDPLNGSSQNRKGSGGYASFQFGWSSAFTMEMILERYQHQRFLFEDTREVRGFIREALDFQTRVRFYQIYSGLEVPRVEIISADGSPLLKAKYIKIKLTDPYQALSAKFFKVLLGGRIFELELGKEYQIKID